MTKPNSSKLFNVGSASKPQQQHFDIADNDRLSKLPDSILCHILSFLPTKRSVGTSILSRRWRFTWTSVAVLDLDDHLFQPYHLRKKRRISASKKSFTNFVNMVLILRSHPFVQRFRLKLTNCYPPSDVNSWIWAAITHNVEELDLSMKGMVKLPRALFSCETIVVLKLASDIDLDVPESVSLPNLKVVHFESLRSLCDDSINRILSGSPILEELVIHSDYEDDVKIFSVLSLSLKTLIIRRNSGWNGNHYKVVVDAPKLEYVELCDSGSQVMVDSIDFKNAASLVKYVFEFPRLSCENVAKLTKTTCSVFVIRDVKVLRCPLHMLKTLLSYAYIRFNNLTQLVVKYCGEDLSILPQVLAKLPNLKVLVLQELTTCNHTITWKQDKCKISCLKYSLKRLQLEGFESTQGEMQMLEYFLENARFLNDIRLLSRYGDSRKSAFLDKLLSNPSCSNAFKIIIS